MNILFNPPINEYLALKDPIDKAIQRVLNSGWYVLGPEVERFENALREFLNVPYCVGVASGLDAITLGLMAYDIGPSDEVIIPNLTAYPTATGVERAGAIPVAVDVNKEDGLININAIKAAITPRTKAILPVHLYGQSCDMTALKACAKEHNLILIEDCAQCLGGNYNNSALGTHGHGGAFSFYPTKNLGGIGDGGAFITHDKTIADKVTALRNYGQSKKYHFDQPGLNSRLDELQAAILTEKLKKLPEWNQDRQRIAHRYQQELPNNLLLKTHDYTTHAYHLFVLTPPNRSHLETHLKNNGIQTTIHYPFTISSQKAFSSNQSPHTPHADFLSQHVLSIPNHPFLSEKEQTHIINILSTYEY